MKRTARALFLAFGCLLAAATPGAAFAEDTHTIAASPAKAKVGSPAKVMVTIEGRNGWQLNAEAPITLKLVAPAEVSLNKDKLGRADLAESTDLRARFEVQATPNEAGTKRIEAEARFVMCQETACKPVKETVALALEAAPAPGPKGKPSKGEAR